MATIVTTNKISWAISVTPKVSLAATDTHLQATEVINENIRKSLGGSGEITADSGDVDINVSSSSASNGVSNAGTAEGTSGWSDGTYGYVTSNATTIAVDTGTDMIIIKNSGFEYDSSATNNISTTVGTSGTDTVQVKVDASATSGASDDSTVLAEIDVGEAWCVPRPGSTYGLLLASGSSHMACEVTVIST
tara:strand:- start:57 stop:632 length:576 start_codon:yes stop_codon:yes gene_type:complete